MAYPNRFFSQSSITQRDIQNTPSTITITDRFDVALAILLMDRALGNDEKTKKIFFDLKLNPDILERASLETKVGFINKLNYVLKTKYLETKTHDLPHSKLWFIHALSEQLNITLNIAEIEGRKTLHKKTDASQHAHLTVNSQPLGTHLSIPVQFGPYFEALSQCAYLEHPELDALCEKHHQQQIAEAHQTAPELLKTTTATQKRFLAELPKDQIEAVFLATQSQPLSHMHLLPPYQNSVEGQAGKLALLETLRTRQDAEALYESNNSSTLQF